ncbi:hypothetical protein C4564_02025 [Candidatus Microgenomates bacterium]|nr:MAG: hypothetical protein C4564_02025 [Candidatus Microgenomates bacterium]
MNALLVVISSLLYLAGIANNIVHAVPAAPAPTYQATKTPEVVGSPGPTASAARIPATTNDSFLYPGAAVLSSGSPTLLSSSDSPGVIAEWYKNKIRSGGYSVKNFVQSTVNGQAKIELQGVEESNMVVVKITGSETEGANIEISN